MGCCSSAAVPADEDPPGLETAEELQLFARMVDALSESTCYSATEPSGFSRDLRIRAIVARAKAVHNITEDAEQFAGNLPMPRPLVPVEQKRIETWVDGVLEAVFDGPAHIIVDPIRECDEHCARMWPHMAPFYANGANLPDGLFTGAAEARLGEIAEQWMSHLRSSHTPQHGAAPVRNVSWGGVVHVEMEVAAQVPPQLVGVGYSNNDRE